MFSNDETQASQGPMFDPAHGHEAFMSGNAENMVAQVAMSDVMQSPEVA
jgi:hypothetical protein